ncbi:MAG TPA: PaaI family thioesterase [Candidatus Binatia bacterium]|nr:PaaI family thioesterase [Candidatus Binatia bacterium]
MSTERTATEIGRAHSGFADLLGYRLTEKKVGYAEMTLNVGPQHLNRLSIPHGGVLATLLDSVTGFAAAYVDDPERPRSLVTLSINVLFLGQARIGETLVARGRRIGGGKSIAYCSGEVTTGDGRPVARAEAVFKYLGKA